MCALKTALAQVKIYGPSGDPHAPPGVSRYTQVPWSTVHANDQHHVGEKGAGITDREEVLGTRTGRQQQWHLGDQVTAIGTFIILFADSIFNYLVIVDSADNVFVDSNEA